MEVGKLIRDLWDHRRRKLKELEKITKGRMKDPQTLKPTRQGNRKKREKQEKDMKRRRNNKTQKR